MLKIPRWQLDPQQISVETGTMSDKPRPIRLADPVQYLKGIGPVRAEALAEAGIHTVDDLLHFLPRKYLDRRELTRISDLKIGDQVTVVGQVTGKGVRQLKRRKIFQVTINDGSGLLHCVWFRGGDWIKDRFETGDRVAVHGKIEFYRQLQMIHPDFDHLDSEEDPLNTGKIVPLYPGSASLKSTGLESRSLRRVFHGIWDRLEQIADFLPEPLRDDCGLLHLNEALRQVHNPVDTDSSQSALYRLKFENHFFLQLLMALRRRALAVLPGRKFPERGEITEQIYRGLPFRLTTAQIRVMRELRSDFNSGQMMNRLLQGDVGSGKTVVALLAAAIVIRAKAQVAVLAPTEILAEQHYRSFKALSSQVHISMALLTGSTPKKERLSILAGLKSGDLSMVIGTHAIIQEDVGFKDLALIIVDEQHRFGVLQRGKLVGKGVYPHVLAMTATPIPRTLAITYHGDMDVSLLDEMPADRAPVSTSVIEAAQLEQAYGLIRSEVRQGHQCFIVYPVIEDNESSDLKAAESGFRLLDRKIFPDLQVSYLHGRMNAAEKDRVMQAVQSGRTPILVSTTVIEVGIDVPQATVMLVENAERFGLTQLHQLRGRIGRSSFPGRCLLVKRGGGDESAERLKILERTSDGFEIADEDLKLRGPGEMFGARQHGYDPKLGDLVQDGPIIRAARQAAFDLVRNDPQLQQGEHRALRQVFMHRYEQELDFLKIH